MKAKIIFNKVDFVVLVFCVVFLLMVLGTTGKAGRENAKRVVCKHNMSEYLRALSLHAADHSGYLPGLSSPISWLWDIDYDLTNQLLSYMGIDVSGIEKEDDGYIPIQDVFYCPSNIPQKKARKVYWRFAVNPETEYGFRISSYFYHSIGSIYVSNPDEVELLSDAVLSDTSNWSQQEYPNGNFARVLCGGMPVMWGIYDSSSHLVTDREPAGGNVGFVDGHIEWRSFSQMEKRWTAPSGCPDGWW